MPSSTTVTSRLTSTSATTPSKATTVTLNTALTGRVASRLTMTPTKATVIALSTTSTSQITSTSTMTPTKVTVVPSNTPITGQITYPSTMVPRKAKFIPLNTSSTGLIDLKSFFKSNFTLIRGVLLPYFVSAWYQVERSRMYTLGHFPAVPLFHPYHPDLLSIHFPLVMKMPTYLITYLRNVTNLLNPANQSELFVVVQTRQSNDLRSELLYRGHYYCYDSILDHNDSVKQTVNKLINAKVSVVYNINGTASFQKVNLNGKIHIHYDPRENMIVASPENMKLPDEVQSFLPGMMHKTLYSSIDCGTKHAVVKHVLLHDDEWDTLKNVINASTSINDIRTSLGNHFGYIWQEFPTI